MGLKGIVANRKLAKLQKMEADIIKTSDGISLGDSAKTEAMKNHFPKEVAALTGYAKQVEDLYLYIKANSECAVMLNELQILPPFIVFPWLEPDAADWNNDIFATYADIFKRIMNQKTPSEIVDYCSKYPYPKWWISEIPCQPSKYQDYWELSERYGDAWRQELCDKYHDHYCVRYHSGECNCDVKNVPYE